MSGARGAKLRRLAGRDQQMREAARGRREMEATEALCAALRAGAEDADLDAIKARGALMGGAAMEAAARGGEAPARWALRQGGMERAQRQAALWGALGRASGARAREAFLGALGLPRELSPVERMGAFEALGRSARESEEAFSGLLDALGPVSEEEALWRGEHYAIIAAGEGAERARAVARHPVHGPALGAEVRARAIRKALEKGDGALGAVQELFDGAAERVAFSEGASLSLIEMAAAWGRLEAMMWMLEQSPKDRAEAIAGEIVGKMERGEQGWGGAGRPREAAERLAGWVRAREEARELGAIGGAAVGAGEARRARM